MKLLYSGATGCDIETFKRLLLVGDEICFMDRPSVTFGGWGTIGHESPLRRIKSEGSPVKLTVYDAPQGPAQNLYLPYIEADLTNPDFIKLVSEGLKNDKGFTSKFIQLQARYGETITGDDVHRALINDSDAISRFSSLEIDGRLMFQTDSEVGRQETFKTILTEGSIQVTTALLAASKYGVCPVSDDPYFARLLAMRTNHPKYIGGTATLAPYLGLEFAKVVIPDQVLQKIEIPDVLAYREKTKDIYDAWAIELNKIAAEMDEINGTNISDAITKLIATELAPKMREYQNEMVSARDTLFGELIKGVTVWEFPALTLAHFTNLGITEGIAAFVAGLRAAVPPIIDYINSTQQAKRSHGVSYLIDLAKK